MTTTNCQWCQSKLETYFAEELNSEDLGLFETHLASCADCAAQVQELRAIDPVVRQVFQRRLATARAAAQWNTRPRVWRLALAGSAVGLAAILGIGVLVNRQAPEQQIVKQEEKPAIEQPATIAPLPESPKQKPSEAPEGRAKPGDGKTVPPAPQPELDKRPTDGPDFAIIDSNGQSSTLDDYRGRVLLIGVISSDEKEAITNLQELYRDFGLNPKVRVRAVANHRIDKIEGANLPIWFNHSSKLMGVQNGQFLLMDAAGASKVKGSLSNAADVAKARAQLGQLTK
jgi:hypothetical protein